MSHVGYMVSASMWITLGKIAPLFPGFLLHRHPTIGPGLFDITSDYNKHIKRHLFVSDSGDVGKTVSRTHYTHTVSELSL